MSATIIRLSDRYCDKRRREMTARLRDEVAREKALRECDEVVRGWSLPSDMDEAERIKETW